jgi:undecaprenyl diphosphate synthase
MRDNTGVKFYIAVNYGGQDEIVRGVQKIAQQVKAGHLAPQDISPALLADALDTAGLPPVDFMIRTSGDLRVSNFLLWQAAYAEFWFTDTNWPDFTPERFVEALIDFGKRKRRFGGLVDSSGKQSVDKG